MNTLTAWYEKREEIVGLIVYNEDMRKAYN